MLLTREDEIDALPLDSDGLELVDFALFEGKLAWRHRVRLFLLVADNLGGSDHGGRGIDANDAIKRARRAELESRQAWTASDIYKSARRARRGLMCGIFEHMRVQGARVVPAMSEPS